MIRIKLFILKLFNRTKYEEYNELLLISNSYREYLNSLYN